MTSKPASEFPTLDFRGFIQSAGDKLVTDSRFVAKAFGKAHKNVLRTIEEIRSSGRPEIAEHGRLNFEPSSYRTKQNKVLPSFLMTKDGLSELAMSFTGDNARIVRIRFLAAFNTMAAELQRRDHNLWEQMQALIAEEIGSQIRASFGSHLMNVRKRELPPLRSKRRLLEMEIQPSLLPN